MICAINEIDFEQLFTIGFEMLDSQRDRQRGQLRRFGYIIISYPTSASGIIVSLKWPQKYRKLN